jgi:sec-independent protein translocase protein TatB
MFDLGWTEMAVVALIALIVIGPKDLPRVLRTAGKWAGKARAIAREFRVSLDDMVRNAELDDVKKDVASVASYNPKKDLEDAVDPTGELARDLASTTGDTKPAKAADAPGEDQQAYAGTGSETPDAGDAGAEEPAGDADSGSSEESSAKSGTGG